MKGSSFFVGGHVESRIDHSMTFAQARPTLCFHSTVLMLTGHHGATSKGNIYGVATLLRADDGVDQSPRPSNGKPLFSRIERTLGSMW